MSDVVTVPTARLEQKTAARTEDAVKVYGKGQTEVRALDGVSVGFASGGFTAVMGPSGSGKSTLLHCVAGLVIVILLAGLAGVAAAILPSRRAAKLNMLRTIVTE